MAGLEQGAGPAGDAGPAAGRPRAVDLARGAVDRVETVLEPVLGHRGAVPSDIHTPSNDAHDKK